MLLTHFSDLISEASDRADGCDSPEADIDDRPEVAAVLHEIAECARRMLASCHYYELTKIECEFRDGTLTLRGVVSSFFLKQLAQSVVSQIHGIQGVVALLDVQYARSDNNERIRLDNKRD